MAYSRFRVPAILMKREKWKPIEKFPDYHVSNHGRVKSFKKKKPLIMKKCIHYKGYEVVYLYRDKNKDIKCFVHRLVAEVFIENVNSHPIVNHKDLNKANNHISNLEWVDESGNMRHWRGLSKEQEKDLPEF